MNPATTRVVVLAPHGRDAAIITALLREGGVPAVPLGCQALGEFTRALDEATLFAIATEEALQGPDLAPLGALLGNQPAWSDLPFIILTARGGGDERNPAAARLSQILGNVTFIERPFHPTSFISVARTAQRGRNRQFEARARIRALHESEERLRRLTETLEERVIQRTTELHAAHDKVLEEMAQRQRAEEQLRHTQKLEAMGQITGGVAHDFNNLLLAVLANLDLLRKRVGADVDGQTLIEGAIQAAQRGAALTQRLLAFARKQALSVKPTDLAGLVRGMLSLLDRSIGPDVELELRLPDGLPPAMVDANQIELALLNLVVNARDAMPRGGQLVIGLQAGGPDEPAMSEHLCLSVTDTGIGMDAETLRRAVEPFFSTKEVGKGTGLGLSMIDGLVRQLQGELRLFSRPGEGTRVECWLPAAAHAALPRQAAETPAPAAPARLHILLVEDDFMIALATRAMLQDLGHEVTDVRSGAKALEVLQRDAPLDLMITDFAMPRMNGAELATKARQLRPDLPILMATGYVSMPDGGDIDLPRLAKPYMQKDLAAKIASVMRVRS